MKVTARQQRDTRQRRMVLDAVMRRTDHPSADEIYQDVQSRDSRVSKATVYRNLKLLAENGDIRQVKMSGADRFDRTAEDHYHIICTRCGTVIDAPIPYFAESDALVAEATGFRISRHRTVFEGLCPRCREALEMAEADK